MNLLCIFVGGGLGAAARYGLTRIPFLSGHAFPWMTFVANLSGALIIGFIAGAVLGSHRLTVHEQALLKTGFCGGLTTFSTFSLEAFELIESGRWVVGVSYILASVICCLIGVFAGRVIAMHVFSD